MFLLKNPLRVFGETPSPSQLKRPPHACGQAHGEVSELFVYYRCFGIFFCQLNRNVRKVDSYPFDS